jgi:hypothetical protein
MPRFTIRQLMVAVVLLGIASGFPIGVARTMAQREHLAAEHAMDYRNLVLKGEDRASSLGRRRVAFHCASYNKWRKAAHHPAQRALWTRRSRNRKVAPRRHIRR